MKRASDHITPRHVDVSAELAMLADPIAYRQALVGVSLEVAERGELVVEQRAAPPAVARPTPARVPEWVKDPVKWQALSRADRRELERHHRRVTGRR